VTDPSNGTGRTSPFGRMRVRFSRYTGTNSAPPAAPPLVACARAAGPAGRPTGPRRRGGSCDSRSGCASPRAPPGPATAPGRRSRGARPPQGPRPPGAAPFPFPHASPCSPSSGSGRSFCAPAARTDRARPRPERESVVPPRGPCIESRPLVMNAIPGTPPDRAPCSTLHGWTVRARHRCSRARQATGARGPRNSDVGWCQTSSSRAARVAPGPVDPAYLGPHGEP
jgi:hypothetical protein